MQAWLSKLVTLASALVVAHVLAAAVESKEASALTLSGTVESGGTGLPDYEVTLLAVYTGPLGRTQELGSDTTDGSGAFQINYSLPGWLPYWLQPILFVFAENDPVMLASAISKGPGPDSVVVNERTTVATGFAFAQFIHPSKIKGNKHGMKNAVHMAANLANPLTGDVGDVLGMPPNGGDTFTYPTFNSLANMVRNCVNMASGCSDLITATTPPGEPAPTDVLRAVANIAK
jgi:hypothetical protein